MTACDVSELARLMHVTLDELTQSEPDQFTALVEALTDNGDVCGDILERDLTFTTITPEENQK